MSIVYPPEFPREMLDAGARKLIHHYDALPPDIQLLWRLKAAEVLSAALDGHAVVPVPEPDEVDAQNTAYWGDVSTGSFVSARPPSDDPADWIHGVDLGWLLRVTGQPSQRAEIIAGWLVAGAHHARPRSAEPAAGHAADAVPHGQTAAPTPSPTPAAETL